MLATNTLSRVFILSQSTSHLGFRDTSAVFCATVPGQMHSPLRGVTRSADGDTDFGQLLVTFIAKTRLYVMLKLVPITLNNVYCC